MKLIITEILHGWVRLVFEAQPAIDARSERIEIIAPAVMNRTRPLAEFQLEALRHARNVLVKKFARSKTFVDVAAKLDSPFTGATHRIAVYPGRATIAACLPSSASRSTARRF